jgi:hypothetical protein
VHDFHLVFLSAPRVIPASKLDANTPDRDDKMLWYGGSEATMIVHYAYLTDLCSTPIRAPFAVSTDDAAFCTARHSVSWKLNTAPPMAASCGLVQGTWHASPAGGE